MNIPFDKKLTFLANHIVIDTQFEKDDMVILGNEKKNQNVNDNAKRFI